MEYDDNGLDELFDNLDNNQEDYILERDITISVDIAKATFAELVLPISEEERDWGSWNDIPEMIYKITNVPLVGSLSRSTHCGKDYYIFHIVYGIMWINVSNELLQKHRAPIASMSYYFAVDSEIAKHFFLEEVSDQENNIVELLEELSEYG